MKFTNSEEIRDLVRGCTFMGTGGGGDPKDGIEWLETALKEGYNLEVVPPEEIKDDELTVCPFLMGSIAPQTEEAKRKKERLGLTETKVKSIQARAVEELEKFVGKKTDALIAIELGGSNTAGVIVAGAHLNKKVIDGDYTGRAIPEIPQTTPYLNNCKMLPISTVDLYGNTCIIKETTGYEIAERIGKHIAAASFGLAGEAGFLIPGSKMKEIVIGGSLSSSYELGKGIREAYENGKDPVDWAVQYLNGWRLFDGKVSKKDWEDKEGYYWGEHTIEGEGKFKGNNLKIWFKNENHISWLNGEPYVTSPDMIIVVDKKTGEPKVNSAIFEGDEVSVIGLKAVPQFRSEAGIDILGPRHFDFDLEYVPIEEKVKF